MQLVIAILLLTGALVYISQYMFNLLTQGEAQNKCAKCALMQTISTSENVKFLKYKTSLNNHSKDK